MSFVLGLNNERWENVMRHWTVWMLSLLLLPAVAIGGEEIEGTGSDVDTPELVEIEPDESALDYMGAVCDAEPQMVQSDEGSTPACTSCPDGSSASDGSLRLIGGYVGDFSGDGQREAILATEGCGGGFNFRHSTVVLREVDGDWEMLEYNDATNIESCEPTRTSQGERLFCQSTDVSQGYATTSVVLRAVADGSLDAESVTELHDFSGACNFDGEFKRTLEEQTIDDVDGDGNTDIVLQIRSATGRSVVGGIPADERCDRDSYEITETEMVEAWKIGPEGLTEVEDVDELEEQVE